MASEERKNETTIAAVNYYSGGKRSSMALIDCWGFSVHPFGKKLKVLYYVAGFSEVFEIIVDEVGLYYTDSEAARLKKTMSVEISAINKRTKAYFRKKS